MSRLLPLQFSDQSATHSLLTGFKWQAERNSSFGRRIRAGWNDAPSQAPATRSISQKSEKGLADTASS